MQSKSLEHAERFTTKQLKLHPLSSLWTLEYPTHYIRTRWEIMLKDRLTNTFHVCQNRLPEVPTKERINWSLGIIEKSSVKIFSSNTRFLSREKHTIL
jgi:hypothetical protein